MARGRVYQRPKLVLETSYYLPSKLLEDKVGLKPRSSWDMFCPLTPCHAEPAGRSLGVGIMVPKVVGTITSVAWSREYKQFSFFLSFILPSNPLSLPSFSSPPCASSNFPPVSFPSPLLSDSPSLPWTFPLHSSSSLSSFHRPLRHSYFIASPIISCPSPFLSSTNST